jgi:nitrate/TMAO reductase-like tetraheme cytochrome c subunit
VPAAALEEPASHLEANFMADHRFQAGDECVACHGEIAFGSDDSSFCADSSCHGVAWPSVDLNATQPHSIPLEGGHAEVWCHDCHEGVQKPEYECANCHEPPEPHFGQVCEDCHTPAGFEGADLGDFQHPMPLENAHAGAACADCHVEGQELTSDCSGCHQPPSGHYGPTCADCHTPTSFKDARLPVELHPIELVGAHQTASCDGCHIEGQATPEYVCSNCHQPPSGHYGADCADCHTPTSFEDARLPAELHPIELAGAHLTASCEGCHIEGQATPEYVCSNCHERPESHLPGECDVCHSPEGFAQSASFLVEMAPVITHDLAGRDDCLLCHDPEGQVKPAPSTHADYVIEQCVLCHKAEE